MTATLQVHPLGRGSAADEFMLVIRSEHAVCGQDCERRNLKLLPFHPARFMHCLERTRKAPPANASITATTSRQMRRAIGQTDAASSARVHADQREAHDAPPAPGRSRAIRASSQQDHATGSPSAHPHQLRRLRGKQPHRSTRCVRSLIEPSPCRGRRHRAQLPPQPQRADDRR